jgi:hypothetical protein
LHVAQRFEHLLETYRRPDGQRWTGQQLDEATGGVVTRSYVTNLRKGHIENPGYEKMRAIGKELREIRDLIWELLEVLPSDRLTPRVRKELQSVVQLLQCYLRAVELELRAAEEPLRSDLDVKSLKAQVLGRIEDLEAREREREELIDQLAPAMESRGYNTGAVRVVMGGWAG